MPSPRELLESALSHQRAGRLYVAAQIYQDILAANPENADAWNLLGSVAAQTGQPAVGVEYIERAVCLNGTVPLFHNNLGNVYLAVGQTDRAVASYRTALALKPDYAEAHNNLGNALRVQGRAAEAAVACRRALELKPDDAKAHNNLGNALRVLGDIEAAVAAYRRAVELNPNLAEAHTNLGHLLKEQDRPEAVASLRRAVELKPDLADAQGSLGSLLRRTGQYEEALALGRRAVQARPDSAAAHNDLGNVLAETGAWDEAAACYRRALDLAPDFPEAIANLGFTWQSRGRYREALECYDRALALKPDHAPAHFNRALVWLTQGDYARGWPEYEWRWLALRLPQRPQSQPVWKGEPVEGKTILLRAEQGLGDTFQFVRYAALVKERGATVIVECQPELRRVLEGCPGIDRLVEAGADLPPFDLQVPLVSLPGLFETTPETVPATVPYLHANPARVEHWRGRIASFPGFKVGIVWQGNVRYREDRTRSLPLACFAALAEVAGVRLFRLQKPGDEPLADIPLVDFGDEVDRRAGPFMDTAAIMACLDLVVAPDTAAAHLAGALGVPVWLALSDVPNWRWLLERTDSPWYPTARLFRQRERGDWTGVFAEMTRELTAQVKR